jgi:hypothetical protein
MITSRVLIPSLTTASVPSPLFPSLDIEMCSIRACWGYELRNWLSSMPIESLGIRTSIYTDEKRLIGDATQNTCYNKTAEDKLLRLGDHDDGLHSPSKLPST